MSQAHSDSIESHTNALTLAEGTIQVGDEFTLYEMEFVREDGHLVEDFWSEGTATLVDMEDPSDGNAEVAISHEDGGTSVISVNTLREMFDDVHSWTPEGETDVMEWDAELR